jgi:hypothetical protein
LGLGEKSKRLVVSPNLPKLAKRRLGERERWSAVVESVETARALGVF